MKRIQGALRNRTPCIFICRHLRYSLNYTDFHDVDEDLRTIADYGGGYWAENVAAGVSCRHMDHTPADTSDYVASSNMKN